MSTLTIDQRHQRELRIAELQFAVERMTLRLADSKHSAGLWASHNAVKSERYHRAATRQLRAQWRLLSALVAEANR